jgi:hypothetical protein
MGWQQSCLDDFLCDAMRWSSGFVIQARCTHRLIISAGPIVVGVRMTTLRGLDMVVVVVAVAVLA